MIDYEHRAMSAGIIYALVQTDLGQRRKGSVGETF
jgi:hypothetical protein